MKRVKLESLIKLILKKHEMRRNMVHENVTSVLSKLDDWDRAISCHTFTGIQWV